MSMIEFTIAPEDAVGTSRESFADAAKAAAEDAARKGWEKRKYHRAQVFFEVDMTITNPGHIDDYRVIIKKR